MEEKTMNNEVVIAIIGVATVCITAIVGFIAGKNNDKSKYVTTQRLEWRHYIRTWVKETTTHIETFNTTQDIQKRTEERIIINSLLNDIKGRVNPYDDQKLFAMLDELYIENDTKTVDTKKLREIVTYLGELLKGDWEETKQSVKIFGSLSIIDLVFIGYVIRWVFDNITPLVLTHLDDIFSLINSTELFALFGLYIFHKMLLRILKENQQYKKLYRPRARWYTFIEVSLGMFLLFQSDQLSKYYQPNIGAILMLSTIAAMIFMILIPAIIWLFSSSNNRKEKIKKVKEGK